MEYFANNAQSTLTANVTSSASSVTVVDAAPFPTTGDFRVLVGTELMEVTSVSGTTFNVTRGSESTSAAAHSAGAVVTAVLMAAALTDALTTPFGASGSGHAPGCVPDPGSTAGSTRYLREDASWDVPPGSGGGTVTSVGMTVPSWLSVTPSAITTSGTFAITGASESANLVVASPNGSSGAVSPRALVLADLPQGTSGDVLIGKGATAPAYVAVSGDATISSSGVMTNSGLQGVPVSNVAPVTFQFLGYNGTDWIPVTLTAAWNIEISEFSISAPSQTPGFIYGFQLGYASATTFTVGNVGPSWNVLGIAGQCVDMEYLVTIQLASQQTIIITSNGAINGNDSFSGPGTVSQTTTAITGSGGTTFTTSFNPRNPVGSSPTISSSSTTIAGTNTFFLSDVCIGDLIGNSTKGWYNVTAITSNTSLTIGTAPGSAFSSASFTIIEQPTIKPGSGTAEVVKTITSNTAMTVGTSQSVTGGSSYRIGVPVASGYLNAWVANGGMVGIYVWCSTQRTTPYGVSGYPIEQIRRLGALQLNSSTQLKSFAQRGTGNRRVYYAGATIILTSGTATTLTPVSTNGAVPPTADELIVEVQLGGGAYTTLSSQDGNWSQYFQNSSSSTDAGKKDYIPMNTAQSLNYENGASSLSTSLLTAGYVENL